MPVLAIHEDEIAEPEQTPELTAIAEIELDIKLARMKACAGAVSGNLCFFFVLDLQVLG